VSNFPTLIGGSPALATAIGAVLVLSFLLGAAWSRRRSLEPTPTVPIPAEPATEPAAGPTVADTAV
jgi:hypothetical protein